MKLPLLRMMLKIYMPNVEKIVLWLKLAILQCYGAHSKSSSSQNAICSSGLQIAWNCPKGKLKCVPLPHVSTHVGQGRLAKNLPWEIQGLDFNLNQFTYVCFNSVVYCLILGKFSLAWVLILSMLVNKVDDWIVLLSMCELSWLCPYSVQVCFTRNFPTSL